MNETEMNEDNCVLDNAELEEICLALGFFLGAKIDDLKLKQTGNSLNRQAKIILKIAKLNDIVKERQNERG